MQCVSPISNRYISEDFMDEYKPTEAELKLQARFTLQGSMHEWALLDKAAYIKYLNNRAGLPFGTIGFIRTEHKNKDQSITVKEIPYASRQTTVELGRKHKISCEQLKEVIDQTMVRYTYRATDIDSGRFVDAVGACSLMGWGKPLSDDQRANKFMHAETKAKRRATLEVCGLAFLDDTEVEDMGEGVSRVTIAETGEVLDVVSNPKGNGAAGAVTAPATQPSAAPEPIVTSVVIAPQIAPATAVTSEAPKQAAGTPTAAPAPTAVAPPVPVSPSKPAVLVPGRYATTTAAKLFAGDPDAIVADADHVNFIVQEATVTAGWALPDMSKWMLDTFGVRKNNMSTTLTLDVFARIMGGIDSALTAAGR